MTNERERHDGISVARILGVSAGLAGTIAIVLAVVAWIFPDVATDRPDASAWRESAPLEPQLQRNPRAEFHALRTRQLARLRSSGWVDEQRGVARIPIEQAMRLLVERGEEIVIDRSVGRPPIPVPEEDRE
ncbi:MAG TPA: hypothetical protein VLT59_17775 [Steroidobacteraceae bacterium]|nr:hypothetical protein [Steroidobacteraceae bacterium]